ncbi:MAG: cytochrome c [Gammaproteobacteria bacterium]
MSIKFIMVSLSVGVLAATLNTAVFAAGDAAAGKAKSASCAGCHNPDGNSANPMWPKLAGQHQKYITKQLMDFKAGKTRKDPLMAGQVAALSETDMKDLAAYFSSQKISAGTADEKMAELGAKIYRGGNSASGVAACMSCHGPSGKGNPLANFPSLASQHAVYLEKAMNDFKSAGRSNDAGKMMQNIAVKMTDKEIKAVASYIQGLQ